MTTTNLFVELIVIGVGAAVWVALLISSVIGADWIDSELLQNYPVMVGLLTLVYVFGIISDRCADVAFDILFSHPIRSQFFAGTREYQDARRLVMSCSSRMADQHEYGRTRIRIVRGWSLNAALIGICSYVFINSQFATEPWKKTVIIYCAVASGALSLASWWAWKALCAMEYLKIKEHSEFLRQNSTLQPTHRIFDNERQEEPLFQQPVRKNSSDNRAA